MSKQETYIDKELSHGNGKRYPELDVSYLFNPLEIGDYNEEGFDSVPSEDFDPGFGCMPAKKVYIVPGPPEFTPELIERLANKEPTTSLGRMWQSIYKEQLKK